MSSENDIVLSVKNVSKCFEMYEKPVHRLYQTLCAGHKKFYKEFWALKDINFEVRKGECVGIIGRNGAGKSTLLQIITGTLAPTTGEVKLKGRIAALLELGSGFNPEFTGKENVYLNGAILGLSKAEIDAKYDEIVAFADIGEFIDQPVKTYSSGMMVRLAFAVNASVDPDILIVDEALAVGDAAFQLKCATRMRNLLESGVTILFVSHDVSSVRTYCNRAIWLANGGLRQIGDVKEVTSRYLEDLFGGNNVTDVGSTVQIEVSQPVAKGSSQVQDLTTEGFKRWGSGEAVIESFAFSGTGSPVNYGERLTLEIGVRLTKDVTSSVGLACAFSIRDRKATDIVCCSSGDEKLLIPRGCRAGERFRFSFSWVNELRTDDYCLVMAVEDRGNAEQLYLDYVENGILFKSLEPFPIYAMTRPACRIEMHKKEQ